MSNTEISFDLDETLATGFQQPDGLELEFSSVRPSRPGPCHSSPVDYTPALLIRLSTFSGEDHSAYQHRGFACVVNSLQEANMPY